MEKSRDLVRLTALGFALFFSPHPACCAVAEEVVELPPFVLTETKISKPWRHAQTSEFEIISQCSDAVTREVVNALYRGRMMTLPSPLLPKLAVPTSVILFDQESDRPTALQTLGRREGHWVNLIKRTAADHEIFCANLHDSDFRYSSTFRFDTHTLMNLRVPPIPPWLQEALYGAYGVYRNGVASIPYNTDVPHTAFIPEGLWISASETATAAKLLPQAQERAARNSSERNVSGRDGSSLNKLLIPVAQLFGPAPKADEERRRWSGELALFARWGMFAEKGRYAEKFWRFAIQACTHAVTPEFFKQSFDLTTDDALAELAWYLPIALADPATRGVAPFKIPEVAIRPASKDEVARLRGDWEQVEASALAQHFPDISAKYREQAGETFHRAYQDGSRDPRLLASLGLDELQSNHKTRAREWLEIASAGNVIRPIAHLELARLRLEEELAKSAKAGGLLNSGQIALVFEPLAKARSQPPAMAAAYDLAAQTWERSNFKPSLEQLAVLIEGARLFPRELDLVARAARLHARHGYLKEARELSVNGVSFSLTEKDKAAFDEILTALPKS